MVELTLLELHIKDANLSANTPFRYGEKEVRASEEPPADSDSHRGAVIALVVGLVFSMILAYLVRKRLRDDEDTEQPFDPDE